MPHHINAVRETGPMRVLEAHARLDGLLDDATVQSTISCNADAEQEVKRMLEKRARLDGLLDDTAAVHLRGQLLDEAAQRQRQAAALRRRAVLQELLHHVVAEHVAHELRRQVPGAAHLVEDDLHLWSANCVSRLGIATTLQSGCAIPGLQMHAAAVNREVMLPMLMGTSWILMKPVIKQSIVSHGSSHNHIFLHLF